MYEILLKLCIVISLILVNNIDARENGCPSEVSSVFNDTKTVVWKSTGMDDEIVISSPPCLDTNQKLLPRVCSNGTWKPQIAPICDKIKDVRKRCPDNMLENFGKCVFVSELRVWEEKCKLAGGTGELHDYQENELIWLPVRRKIKYGPYESVRWGKDYGHPLHASYKFRYSHEDLFNKNCLATSSKGENLLPVNCTDKHIFVCPVAEDDMDCPENCISTGIGTQNCFCKKTREKCSTLAKINSLADKIILAKLLDEGENCYIGESFTTELRVLGHRQSLKKDVWSFTTRNLSCSLCVEPLRNTTDPVEMVLEFNEKNTTLTLVIYSSNLLYKNGHPDYIYCFTDASKELKKRVKVDKLHDLSETFFKITYYRVKLEKYIGHYWCEAAKRGTEELVTSNQILAYRLKTGNEYSLRLEIKQVCNLFSCTIKGGTLDYSELVDERNLKILKDAVDEVRVMEVFYFDSNTMDLLLHLTTKDSHDVEFEFMELQSIMSLLHENIQIIYFRNSEYCLPDANHSAVSWPVTKIGEVAVPINPCLVSSNLPLLRICLGNFQFGSEWSTPNGECQNSIRESTKYIYSMFLKNVSSTYVADIERFTKDEKLTVLGHYFLTKILKKITDFNFSQDETYDVYRTTFKITSNLMKMDSGTLIEAEKHLNVTDEIIDTLENFADKWNTSDSFLVQNQNVILHIANPYTTNTVGILMYIHNNKISLKDFKRNDTYEHFEDKENLQFAYYVPDELLNQIPKDKWDTIRIISTIFLNSHFFPSETNNLSGPVVSIIIQGLDSYLPRPISVWFKLSEQQENPTCVFWDYGKRTFRHKGNWSGTGGKYMGTIGNSSAMHVCSFSHLTHFALLVANAEVAVGSTSDFILDIITVSGDILSLIGICGILATALLFKNWRRKPGTKILLNLSSAISLEIIAMFLIQFRLVNSDLHCQILGPILHYLILCKHFWMLVYAFLQYNRFVKVLAAIPNNIVLKSVIFGWGFAAVPVLIVYYINPYTYSINNYNFCYPKNLCLYLGVYLPIFLIVALNTIVFFIVMRNISSTIAEPNIHKIDSRTQKLQLKLAALLFFVLGVPILFALFSNLIEIKWLQIIMIYVLCITSNVQGFILFLFYVVLNKETRQKWINHYMKKKEKSPPTSSISKS